MTEILSYEEQKAKLDAIEVPDSVIKKANECIAAAIALDKPWVIIKTGQSEKVAIPGQYTLALNKLIKEKGYATRMSGRASGAEIEVYLNNHGRPCAFPGGYIDDKPNKHFWERH